MAVSASRLKDIYSSAYDLIKKCNSAVMLCNKAKLVTTNANRSVTCLSSKINAYSRYVIHLVATVVKIYIKCVYADRIYIFYVSNLD
jgi:hypothetical protein